MISVTFKALYHRLTPCQASMNFEMERRNVLDERRRQFEERRSNFRQFIIDNVHKIHRQHKTFSAMRLAQVDGREAMAELLVASREMRQRYSYKLVSFFVTH